MPMSGEALVDLVWTFAVEDPRPDVTYTVPIGLAYLVDELRQDLDKARAEVERLRAENEAMSNEAMAAFDSWTSDENDRLRRERNDYFAEVERLREEIDHLRNPSQGEQVTMAERIDTLTQALQRADAAVQRVRDLHVRRRSDFNDDSWCDWCDWEWPCSTIRALDGEQS